MILNKEMYVPALSWRMGEYQALTYLKDCDKDKVMPLIVIPEIEYDFESRKQKKTICEYVGPFPGRFKVKWDTRPAWLALHSKIAGDKMADGRHVFDYILDGLRLNQAQVVPVLTLDCNEDTVVAVARAVDRDGLGAGMRVRLENLMAPDIEDKIKKLSTDLSLLPEDTDLIIDLWAPNFEPYHQFATALINRLYGLRDLSAYRNFVIVSTAYPESFGQIAKGIDIIPRHDWLFYKVLLTSLPSSMRCPNYGDYTIVHPEFNLNMDMRMIKPAGKIAYTTPTTWHTCKGRAFRDDREQMYDHCKKIVTDPQFLFRGADFSDGDRYIAKCAAREAGPSNQTYWKRVTINHHITAVVNDLANYYASPKHS